MQHPPVWVPCAPPPFPEWTAKKRHTHRICGAVLLRLPYLRCVPRNCGNEAPRSASHEEARAPFSSCTAIVAAWWKPLLFGRCRRIHAPPPPLTTFVSGVWPVMHLIRGKERRQHSPSLSFCPSSFSSRGRCRLPRLRVEFAPLPPFHLSSFVHTAAHTHIFAHLHLAQFCSAHAIPAIMSHLLFLLLAFFSSFFILPF